LDGSPGFLGEAKNKRDLSTLHASDVARFRDREAKELSRSTANLGVKVLRICFGEAARQGLLAVNPAVRVKLLKSTAESKRRAFTLNEIKRILRACGNDAEWRGLVLFGLYLGQRLGDLAKLTGARSIWIPARLRSARARPADASYSRWCNRSPITWHHSQQATIRTPLFSLARPARSGQRRCRISSVTFSLPLRLLSRGRADTKALAKVAIRRAKRAKFRSTVCVTVQ
jgi:integrase